MAVSMVTLGMTFFLEQMGISLFAGDVVLRSVVRSLLGAHLLGASRRNIPNKIRSQAMALAVAAAQWVANYLVSWTFR